MTQLGISLGVMMVPIGIYLMATQGINKAWIWFIGLIGFGALIWAAYEARKEDRKSDYRTKLFEAFVRHAGVDVEKVRRETEEGRQDPG